MKTNMKKLQFIISAALLSAASLTLNAAKPQAAGEPAIEFAQTSHDFGTIAEKGGPVKHEFIFTNTGDAPLMVLTASASCGCTRPEYPKKPIAPGKSGKIKVTYLPEGRPGEFTKTVTVKTNAKAKNQKKVTLKIKGFVNPAK
jgi:hypothetical protein